MNIFSLKKMVERLERRVICRALHYSEYNRNRAAILLGMKRSTLIAKMAKYKIAIQSPYHNLNKEFCVHGHSMTGSRIVEQKHGPVRICRYCAGISNEKKKTMRKELRRVQKEKLAKFYLKEQKEKTGGSDDRADISI